MKCAGHMCLIKLIKDRARVSFSLSSSKVDALDEFFIYLKYLLFLWPYISHTGIQSIDWYSITFATHMIWYRKFVFLCLTCTCLSYLCFMCVLMCTRYCPLFMMHCNWVDRVTWIDWWSLLQINANQIVFSILKSGYIKYKNKPISAKQLNGFHSKTKKTAIFVETKLWHFI